MKAQQLQVSKHAVERWIERVNPGADAHTAQREIRDAVRHSWKLCDAEDGATALISQSDAHGITVLIVTEDGTVATIYRPIYGFGEEIDAVISERLLLELKEVRQALIQATDAAGPKRAEIDREMAAARREAEALKLRIKRLEQERQALSLQEDELAAKERAVARRLYHSVDYRLELLAGKHSKVG